MVTIRYEMNLLIERVKEVELFRSLCLCAGANCTVVKKDSALKSEEECLCRRHFRLRSLSR